MPLPTLYCSALINGEYAKGIYTGVDAEKKKYTVHFWDGRTGYYDTLENIHLTGKGTNRIKSN